jgi:sulfotransferase
MKSIYFLGGLPRSGNTLLSALLNQNPEIYVSPLSPLLETLSMVDKDLNFNEATLSANFEANTSSALKHYVQGFYNNVSEPVVIDRNKGWGNKESILTACKYITETPKVIFTVRDIPSILASFLSLVGENQDNFIDNSLREYNIKPYGKQTQNDLRCDLLMNGQVRASLCALTELLQMQVAVCLVEYDDLVRDPQKELNDIYDFLELPHFVHNFNNVEKKEQENLQTAGLPTNLHDVRSKVEKTALDPKLVLPLYSQNKYSGLEFWRDR